MRILQINIIYKAGSTGKIMSDISDVLENSGNESYMISGYNKQENTPENLYCIHPKYPEFVIRKDIFVSRITGRMGYNHKIKTKKALKWIDEIKPNLIHLHNIHGNWINVFYLMNYITDRNIPVVWTLHDCWSFTGRCSHFELASCEKWKTGCYDCTNRKVYPITYFWDRSKNMWIDKKESFTKLESLNIVTPSNWLADYVRKSYFANQEISVIHNGIDLELFKPRIKKSSYYNKYKGRKVILCVSSSWSKFKGLMDIYSLNKKIDHDKFVIFIVGLSASQLSSVPDGIIGIGRTSNQTELAEIYSEADVFINPTYQDNYPTVNMEAIACGTPVITYDTGGSVESVNEKIGIIVDKGNIEELYEAILNIIENQNNYQKNCRGYAVKHFDKYDAYNSYISLYKSILGVRE